MSARQALPQLWPAAELLMAGELTLFGGGLPQRLPREVRQVLAVQQQTALVHARKIEAVAACAELGLLSVAQLSSTEAQLVQMVPHAQGRLSSLVDAATMVIGSQIARLAREL